MDERRSSAGLLLALALGLIAVFGIQQGGCKATHEHDHNHHYDAQRHDHYIHFQNPWKKNSP